MDYDRRWLRPLRRRTRLPTGPRLAAALVLIAASLGVGMFARMRAVAEDSPALVVGAFTYEGAAASQELAADLRTRLVNHISGTTSLRVSVTAPATQSDAVRATGRLIESSGLLTLHLRLQEVNGGREVASSLIAGDVRRLDALVNEASESIVRQLRARGAVPQP